MAMKANKMGPIGNSQWNALSDLPAAVDGGVTKLMLTAEIKQRYLSVILWPCDRLSV